MVKEEGWLSWLRAPAECAAAGKENPALQTSCFCCVPSRPKLSLTERGQIPRRWGKPWARLRPCQTSVRGANLHEAGGTNHPEPSRGFLQQQPGTSRAFPGLPPAGGNIPSLPRAPSSSSRPRGRRGSRKSRLRSAPSRPAPGIAQPRARPGTPCQPGEPASF